MQQTENYTENKLIPIGKAASSLGVSRDTLRRWEKRGKINVLRSPTNRRYYNLEQLKKAAFESKTKVDVKKQKEGGSRPLAVILAFFVTLLLTAIFVYLLLSLVFNA